MLKVLTLLFLFSSTFQSGNSQYLEIVKDVCKLVNAFKVSIATKGNMVEVFAVLTDDNSKDSRAISTNMNIIQNKLNYMNNFITNKLQEVHSEIRRLPLKQQIQHLEDKLSLHIQTVEVAYSEIQEVLQGRDSARYKDNTLHRCGTGTSPQQLLLGLYVDITKTETKAMAVLTFFTSLQRKEEHAWEILLRRYIRRYNAYAESFTRAFNNTSRDHRSCDPNSQVSLGRDRTYAQFNEYDQITTFHRAISIASRGIWPSCSSWFPELYKNLNKTPDHCKTWPFAEACSLDGSEKCRGELTDCFTASVTRCLTGGQFDRRYLWLRDITNSRYYGDPGRSCSGDYVTLQEDRGDSCVCRCMQPNLHAISLVLALSDTAKNRVITGIRLARVRMPWEVRHVTYIQIKQGTLQSDGRIIDESDTWEPSEPSQNLSSQFIFTTKGHGIHLDNLVGMDDEVLTGIGFRRSGEAPQLRIKLQIQVTKFSYDSGRLGGDHWSRIIFASDRWSTRYIPGAGNPLMHMQENVPSSSASDETSKYVVIEASSLADDAGQTELPLLDLVPVEGRPASPLGGVGIFHKSAPNYGGFFSFRAIGINIAKYFTDSVKVIPTTLFTSDNKTMQEMISDVIFEVSRRKKEK